MGKNNLVTFPELRERLPYSQQKVRQAMDILEKRGDIELLRDIANHNVIKMSPQDAEKVKQYLTDTDKKRNVIIGQKEESPEEPEKPEEKSEPMQPEKKPKSSKKPKTQKKSKKAKPKTEHIESAKDLAKAEGPQKTKTIDSESTKKDKEEKELKKPTSGKSKQYILFGAGFLILAALGIWYMKRKREKDKEQETPTAYKQPPQPEQPISNLERLRQSYRLRTDER